MNSLGLVVVAVVSIPLDWTTFKWAGLVLCVFSVLALFKGDMPDNPGTGFGNGLRWIAWPLLAIWIVVFIGRGIML